MRPHFAAPALFLSQFTNTWLKQGGGMQCAGGWCSPPTVQSGFGDKWQTSNIGSAAVLQGRHNDSGCVSTAGDISLQ